MPHATVADTFPAADGRSGVARADCLDCGWSIEHAWHGPANPYEPNALMVVQSYGSRHERYETD